MTLSAAVVQLEEVSCWCGMPHAIPRALYDEARLNKSRVIFCPLGHQYGWRETDAHRLP